MTLVQLEYIIALDSYRHFAMAAEKCHVTQPTLSMQIQKLEDELGVLLFDRTKHPVLPTEIGVTIIEQARKVLSAKKQIDEVVRDTRNEITGSLKVGVIPTLAPYLLPLFLTDFLAKYPKIDLELEELLTHQIIEKLKLGLLDVGLVVTPVEDRAITEIPVFYEPFVVFAAPNHPLSAQQEVDIKDLNTSDVWLLSDGHCFRNQVFNLCEQKAIEGQKPKFQCKTGSLEMLMKIVEQQYGFTLLPALATLDMKADRRALVREFVAPQPKREISLIIHRGYLKRKLIECLKAEILAHIPVSLQEKGDSVVVGWA
jgi:LysR family hydrogen peroxide-inducible transcriptional activator